VIIPKADFNKLRQSVPAFGDVFSELAKRRVLAGSPLSPVAPNTAGSPIPLLTPESELRPPPGFASSEVP
jgi:hypothetical protein